MRRKTGAPSAKPLRLQPVVELGEVGSAGQRQPGLIVRMVLPARIGDGRAIEELPALAR